MLPSAITPPGINPAIDVEAVFLHMCPAIIVNPAVGAFFGLLVAGEHAYIATMTLMNGVTEVRIRRRDRHCVGHDHHD
jgi:hypothetical protein